MLRVQSEEWNTSAAPLSSCDDIKAPCYLEPRKICDITVVRREGAGLPCVELHLLSVLPVQCLLHDCYRQEPAAAAAWPWPSCSTANLLAHFPLLSTVRLAAALWNGWAASPQRTYPASPEGVFSNPAMMPPVRRGDVRATFVLCPSPQPV